MVQNKALIFKEAPTAWPEIGKHLKVESSDFDVDQAPPSGGITAKVNYVSFDPYQRGRMRKPEIKSYSPPFELGKPVTNAAIVTVLKSDNSKFKPGDVVKTFTSTGEYTAISKEELEGSEVLDNPYKLDPSLFIGALGMPGLTAYSSLHEIGQPKKGETIFISAASGAVGAVVGQLAKREGLKVIGSVGSDEKLKFITNDLGFDGGFNYKKEKASEALERLAPDGIDIYFENVSLAAVLALIFTHHFTGRRRTTRGSHRGMQPTRPHHRLRHDLAVQRAPSGSVRRAQPHADRGQAHSLPRLHCEGR